MMYVDNSENFRIASVQIENEVKVCRDETAIKLSEVIVNYRHDHQGEYSTIRLRDVHLGKQGRELTSGVLVETLHWGEKSLVAGTRVVFDAKGVMSEAKRQTVQ